MLVLHCCYTALPFGPRRSRTYAQSPHAWFVTAAATTQTKMSTSATPPKGIVGCYGRYVNGLTTLGGGGVGAALLLHCSVATCMFCCGQGHKAIYRSSNAEPSQGCWGN